MYKDEIKKLITMNKNLYYTYSLNRNEKPFYIGKGKNKRIFFHEKELLNPTKKSNLHKLYTLDHAIKENSFSYSIFSFTNSNESACNEEIELIKLIGRNNLTDGSEGLIGLSEEAEKRRISLSEESKIEKISSSQLGRKFSNETKEKMRISRKKTAIKKAELSSEIRNLIIDYKLDYNFPNTIKSLKFLQKTLATIKPLVEQRGE